MDAWRRARRGCPRISRVQFYDSNGEVPTKLRRHELAVVGSQNLYKWVYFECPCGFRHERVILNLNRAYSPSWRIEVGPPPSISPSVDIRGVRRCHFVLERGRVHWVADRPAHGP